MRNEQRRLKKDDSEMQKEKSLCHWNDAFARAWMAREDGRSTGWACKGRTQSAWVRICRRINFWRRTFISRSATAGTGWIPAVGDESGDAGVVGIRLSWEMVEREDHGRDWKSLEPSQPWRGGGRHLFCLHAAKASGPGGRLVRRNRGGHCAESPTRESRLYFFWVLHA